MPKVSVGVSHSIIVVQQTLEDCVLEYNFIYVCSLMSPPRNLNNKDRYQLVLSRGVFRPPTPLINALQLATVAGSCEMPATWGGFEYQATIFFPFISMP